MKHPGIIFQGDCLDVLNDINKIEEKSIQLIFADPPYNLSGKGLKTVGSKTGGDWSMVNEDWDKRGEAEFIHFTNEWVKACENVLKPNGSIFIACSYHNIGESVIALKTSGFEIKNIITWNKTNAMPNITRRVLTHSTEFVIWAVKGKGWIFNYDILKELNPDKQSDGTSKQMRDVWNLPLVQGKERIRDDETNKAAHPTQKPEEMLKRIILGFSNDGDTILDPFCGSGTTCVVAKQFGRNYIGIEKEQKYIEIIKKRLKEQTTTSLF
jgi:site-specific DNA-methyltransferase (adenine-specific)/modification methylase